MAHTYLDKVEVKRFSITTMKPRSPNAIFELTKATQPALNVKFVIS